MEVEEFRALTRSAQPLGRVSREAAQTITTATVTPITFDTAVSNNWGMVDISGAPTRITFKHQGIYLVGARVIWEDDSTGIRYAAIRVNGSTVASANRKAAAGTSETEWTGRVRNFNVGDYIELIVEQTSGGDLDVTNASVAALWQIRT